MYNKREMLQLIEENPVILGINQESDLKLAPKTNLRLYLPYSDLSLILVILFTN